MNELIEQQKNEELNELRVVMQKSGMDIADIIQIAQTRMAEAQ